MPGSSGPHQSNGRERSIVVGHRIHHETRGPGGKPGWPTLNEGEREPCLETVALTNQMKEREALMVATTYIMKPGALGRNLGGLHPITRGESHAWKQCPSPIK